MSQYYNELLGDSSFLMAGLLALHLREAKVWNNDRWMDDSLVSGYSVTEGKLVLNGVMIWGIGGNTSQWTEPFRFMTDVTNNKLDLCEYVFSFGDNNRQEVLYEVFDKNRELWKDEEIAWKYEIHKS